MTDHIHTNVQDPAAPEIERSDGDAMSLIGALIGDFYITARVKPGKRWLYVAHNIRTGRQCFLKGYELIRAARVTASNGGVIVMPRTPWRDEPSAAAANG